MYRLKPTEHTSWVSRHWIAMMTAGWLAFFFIGGYFLFSHKSDPRHLEVAPHEMVAQMDAADGLGHERRAILVAASKAYASAHPEAAPAIREGKQFAPPEALNAELARKGEHWRVRRVEGLKAVIYEVS